jgi:cell wall-associated NlpC family hydrolase
LLDLNDLIGIPYKKGGNGEEGFDCYRLVREVKRRLGEKLPEFSSLTEDESIHQMVLDNVDFVKQIENPEPYCLVVFKVGAPFFNHIGIVLEDCDYFIHILENRVVEIHRLSNLLWKNRTHRFYRWKGKSN